MWIEGASSRASVDLKTAWYKGLAFSVPNHSYLLCMFDLLRYLLRASFFPIFAFTVFLETASTNKGK